MSWNDLEERTIAGYMRKRMSGGRGKFARIVDYIALRVLVFIVSYFLFLPRFGRRGTAALLSTIALALVMLLLHMGGAIRYASFYSRELLRIRKQLLRDRLLLLDMQTAIPLVSMRCPTDTAPVILQRALPVNANDLLVLVRTHTGCGELHVFSCSAYDDTATAFAARANGKLALHAPEELFAAAGEAGMTPSEADAKKSILAQVAFEKRRKRRKSMQAYIVTGARKYALIALLLLGLSFVSGYALYYRMLAGFCMTIAAFGFWRGKAGTGE